MEKSKLHFEDAYTTEQRKRKFESSEEFLDAEIPFEYKYTFPSGEKLEAHQSNQGGGFVIIKRGEEVIFDASKLLPKDWKFVTPTYFKKHPKEETLFDYFNTTWASTPERKFILLGEFKRPQDFIILLHEIGHTITDNPEEGERLQTIEEEIYKAKDIAYEVLLSEEQAILRSKRERNAWAYAIRALKNIQQKTAVDLKSLFPAFSDLKSYVNEALATYRGEHEWIIKKGYDEEFYKALQKLFDKYQY